MTPQRPLTIRAVIPHYFKEGANPTYGSGREGVRLVRSVALLRCLNGLWGLRNHPQDLQMNLIKAQGELLPPQNFEGGPLPMEVEIHVFVNRDDYLSEALRLFQPSFQLHQLDLSNPMWLALEARDWLVSNPNPMDLNLYLEDDLVVQDRLFPEKILWMAEYSGHQAVLLPHRYENLTRPSTFPRLYVDGLLDLEEIAEWHSPMIDAASGCFRGGQRIKFDIPNNPHSGCFALSKKQVNYLASRNLPTDGFFGPLETAATYTVGKFFTLLKPSFGQRQFLSIEHAHPSFIGYLGGGQSE